MVVLAFEGRNQKKNDQIKDGVGADDDAETPGQEEDAEEGPAAGIVEVVTKSAGIAIRNRDVVIRGECDGAGDDGDATGEIRLDLEKIGSDEVNERDHHEAEEEFFVDARADRECGLGLPGKIRDGRWRGDCGFGRTAGCDQIQNEEKRDDPGDGFDGEAGNDLGTNDGAIAGEDMPEEKNGNDGDSGKVDGDIAEGVAELGKEGAGADGLDYAAGRVGEIEDGADFVEDDERKEEGEDVEWARTEEPVGLGALGADGGGM